ncbi:SpaN/EivJ family type III secretion system needle length determinant [Yersinia canariae]|uniref:SpaN/EivJ family type III secretion system needle length determinant n=1 Tax=Yersinia canariae TaxID=2607663 RepID=UPI0011A0C9B7|nr:type III secretion system needle length determinant, SpaN/EivJ family [Yersinia canariae]
MVAIKQAANSALPDIRKDESTAISRPAMLGADNGQAVTFVQQEAQKKVMQLLAKAKQRKKQAEEQLVSSAFSPMILINSMPVSTQLVLPNMAQLPDSTPVQKPSVWAQGYGIVEKPQAPEKTEEKLAVVTESVGEKNQPALLAHAVVDCVSHSVAPEVKLQPNMTQRDNSGQPLSHSTSERLNNLEIPVAAVFSTADGHKEGQSYPTAYESTPVVSPESQSELPPLETKENALVPDQAFVPAMPQPVAQTPTVTQPEVVKAAPATFISAPPESAATEAKLTVEHRTLSYTFTQWKNSPVVTFELSRAGELTAMTSSAEVQHALQDKHHWLASENSLQFRDEQHDEPRRGQQHPDQEDETS